MRTRSHNHAFDPQSDEGKERSKGCHDISIICSRFLDHCSQLAEKEEVNEIPCARRMKGKKNMRTCNNKLRPEEKEENHERKKKLVIQLRKYFTLQLR